MSASVATTTTTTEASGIPENIPTEVTATTARGYKITSEGSLAIATGAPHPHQIPHFDDPYEKREWIKQHMAGAFRVFARKGYTEGGAGHISVRDPVDPTTFWINPVGKHFGLMKASDLVRVDKDGNIVGGAQSAVNTAGFAIHSALHAARPDIHAACHTHSVYGKAWSLFGKPLDMINQDACTIYDLQAVYDDFGGVAVEAEEGRLIARALGDKGKVAILMNHGLLTCGETVDEAAYLFTLTERCCEVQLAVEAASLNGLRPITIGHEEAAYTCHINGNPEMIYTDFQPDYEFEVYKDDSFLN